MTEPQTLSGGRYLLVKRLGEGGMATVYRGFDQRLQVWRAIKVLLPEYAKKKKIMARFETEAQTMAMLEHPHIVRVYDVDREGDFPYIVMELVEGGCLVDWLEAHGPMPPRMAVDVIVEVCQALQFAHDRQIIHRDIKPHNIMIDRKGICRLTDFGIARAGDSEDALTKTGAVMGTWGYMAPEQRTDAKHVDGRADIYALAASLFSLLTDKTPMDLFLAEREISMLDGIHEAVIPVLIKATEYRKEDRYDSATAFAAALLGIRDALPENPPGTPPIVGEVSPLPPPPDPDKFPAVEPSETASGTGAKPQTLIPGDTQGFTASPNFTMPPMEDDGFEEMSAQPRETWQPAPQGGNQGADRSTMFIALIGMGVALLALLVVVFVVVREPPAPTPIMAAAAPTPTPVADVAPPDQAGGTAAADTPPAPTGTTTPGGAPPAASTPRPIRPPTSKSTGATAAAKPTPVPATQGTPEPAEPEPAPEPPPPPKPKPQCFEQVSVPGSAKLGETLSVRARTCKDSEVTVHYRVKGQGPWFTRKTRVVMGMHTTTIPVDAQFAGGLEWYLSSDGVTHGSPSRPYETVVSGGGATE